MLRSQPAEYGFQLHEFDPFFNYRATQFLLDNGLNSYFEWHDYKSWYPEGRNVSDTSQVMLHITTATLYTIFNGGSNLYDFTILFPVIIGSLTVVILFAFVRVIGGTSAGLFSALLFSISLPVIVRGQIGWFKSEPLGLFYGLLGVYLFLSGIKSENRKIAFAKLMGGGIFLGLGLSAWGGIQFLLLPLAIFFLALPFFRKDFTFIIIAIPVFAISLIFTAASFERPGLDFVTGYGGFLILGPTVFLVICSIIRKLSKKHGIRNGLIYLGATVTAGVTILFVDVLHLPSFRYLNAVNPFLTTTDPLVDSVAEHAITTTAQSFFFLSILMVFAGIGVWLLLRNKKDLQDKSKISDFVDPQKDPQHYLDRYRIETKYKDWFDKKYPNLTIEEAVGLHNRITNDMIAFALIIGMLGVYISSAFVRLEIFASLSVIILASLGLSIISSNIFMSSTSTKKKIQNQKGVILKTSYVAVIVFLLIMPMIFPANINWVNGSKGPPTILNGGTSFNIATNDWLDSLEWIKNNTPPDAVIASWWDYGYWITTMGERTSLADNATLSTDRIKRLAQMLISPPDESWKILNEVEADYVLVFIASQRIDDNQELYVIAGGADESKKQWFMRIAGEPTEKYVQSDGISGTDYFWDNTMLGQMFPFTTVGYLDVETNSQSLTYVHGYTGIYTKNIKFPSDGDGPLKLVYSSPSFDREKIGQMINVLIYEVNKDYKPN